MSRTSRDPPERFSERVDYYVRYRPSYPAAMFKALREEFGLGRGQIAADVGSGTGILSERLVQRGLRVFGIEPNGAMRGVAEKLLGGHPEFTSVEALGEATTLAEASVNWVFAAQSFHWFDVGRCRDEFRRILRPGGHVALIWNTRRHDTRFLVEYEEILRKYGTDYADVRHERAETDGRIATLFAPRSRELRTFHNEQRLDLEGLRGRTFSSSYTPPPEDARRDGLGAALAELFARHAPRGFVVMRYETRMYVGTVD